MRTSEPVKTIVLPATGRVARDRLHRARGDFLQQTIELLLIVVLVEELHDRFRHYRTDPFDAIDLGEGFRVALRRGGGGLPQSIEIAEVAGEEARIRLADMADAECVDEAIEVDLATRLDRAHQIADARFLVALAGFKHSGLEPENVGRMLDQTVAVKRLDLFEAQPLDVESVAADEVAEPLDRLRRADQRARAAADRIGCCVSLMLAHRFEPQAGHVFGNSYRFAFFGRFPMTTSTICGITSPARWMITVSPMRISLPSRMGAPSLPMPAM